MSTIIISVLLVALIGLLTYQIRIDSHTREKLFEVQIEMGKGQAAMTRELPWSDLKKIIDEIINFTISNYIITNGIAKMNDEELALNWTLMLNELCTKVEVSLSDEIKRQMLKTVSEEYLRDYIKNSVQLVIVYKLQTPKKNKVGDKLESIQKEVTKNKVPTV